MRILHVTKKYPKAIGGDSICVFNLEREQAKVGHKVFILTTNSYEIIDKDNLYKFGIRDTANNWDRVTLKRILSLVLFFIKSLWVIKKIKPDIIHSHSADLGFIISIWARFIQIPIINTCHGVTFPYEFLSKTKRFAELFFLKFGFFDKIITVDPNSLEFFRKYRLRNYEYLNILGVDADEFKKIKDKIFISEKHAYPKFIFVGRIDPLKGLNYLLQATAQIKEKIGYFEVWIIGDGPHKENLIKLSAELKTDKRVKFFKAITDRKRLIKMYCLADVFVLPSLLETFSLSVVDAWAARLAVISTPVGVVATFGKDRENVLIVPARDAKAIAEAMNILLKNDSLRQKIASHGWEQLPKERFDWKIVVKNVGNLYNHCTAQSKNRAYYGENK